jgi:hypothetical protein
MGLDIFSKPLESQFGPLGKDFNLYQEHYLSLSKPTEDTLTLYVPLHKISLFGSQVKKQAYRDALAKLYGWPAGEASWLNISSAVPEIVGDLRMRDGQYFINSLNIGHELKHSMSRMDARVLDSDLEAWLK